MHNGLEERVTLYLPKDHLEKDLEVYSSLAHFILQVEEQKSLDLEFL